MAISAIAVVGLGVLIARAISEPINKLVEAAEQLAQGNTQY